MAALRAGDTLCLRDGVYTETIAPRTNGTAAAPITIKALNDGAVTIDGQGVRKPLNLGEGTGGGNWFVIEGLVLRNGSEHVAIVKAANNVLRRISVYDANTNVNSQTLLIWGSSNTIEDCIVGGSSRFALDIFGGGNVTAVGNTVRRCLIVWTAWDGKNFCGIHWLGVYGLGIYNASQNRLENNIVYARTVNGVIVQANSSGVTASNNQVLGNISVMEGRDYDGSIWHYGSPTWPKVTRPQPTSNPYGAPCDDNVIDWTWPQQRIAYQLFGQGILSNNVFRDNLAADAVGLGFGALNPGGGQYNSNTFDRFTLLNNGAEASASDGGKGAQVKLLAGMTLTNSCISPKPAGWTQGAGARLQTRYVDGVLTSEPLWPWPMQGRAMAELGIDVTAIAQKYIKQAEAACR